MFVRFIIVSTLLPLFPLTKAHNVVKPVSSPGTINKKSLKEQEIIRVILKNYQDSVLPTAHIKNNQNKNQSNQTVPVIVAANLRLLSLSSFNDVTMTFTAQFRFQQEWFDSRLKFNSTYFKPQEYLMLAEDQNIWLPDTFFQNEQYGQDHKIDRPNNFRKIRSDGRVKYSKRLTMNFSCPMDLLLFPHDSQKCAIEFSSYAYTTSDIVYVWDSISQLDEIRNAVDAMPKFTIANITNSTCNSKTATGEYSCLSVILLLKREFSYFLLQLYLPSCMMVAVGCVSFWIDWRSAPARVPLAIVTLLTITTQSAGINSSLPPVSYTKAIDVWIGACIVFIFGALLEFAVVNYVGTNEEKRNVNLTKRKVKQRMMNFNRERRLSDDDQCHCDNLPKMCSNGVLVKNRLLSRAQTVRRKFTSRWQNNCNNNNILREDSDDEGEGDCFNAQEYVDYRKKCSSAALLENHALLERGRSENSTNACRAEKIDTISRIIFPVGFLCFNIVYWALYIPKMTVK